MIGAGISIHFYIEKHHEDVFDHRDPPPSFAVLYRSVKRAKNVVGAIFVIRSYWQHASEKGDWNDDPAIHPTLFCWSWLISDCKSSTWWFSLWSLARRMIMVANVNLIDGPVNAALSLGIQISDSLLLFCLFPFNSYNANLQQAFGAVTNVLTYFAITLPILSPSLMPSWLGDMVILALSVVATGVAALTAMVGPVLAVFSLVKSALVKMFGLARQCSACHAGLAAGGGGAFTTAHAHLSGELQGQIDEELENQFLPEDEKEEEEEQEKDEEEGGGGADNHEENMHIDASMSGNGGALATVGIIGGIVAQDALRSKPSVKGSTSPGLIGVVTDDLGQKHTFTRNLLERSRYCAE